MDSLFGEIRNLIKKINRVSHGQAKIVEIGDSMNIIEIEITPNDGLYKGASFLFKIRVDPYHLKSEGPTVFCLTPIYHPNIDTSDLDDLLPLDDEDYSSNVCLNMFDNWQPSYGLDGMVNGLLFLFYHPEIEDPLSPYISPGMSPEEFSENVHRSLLGEEVDGFFFERNLCDKEYEILRKEIDSLSELKIESCDPVLPSAEGAKEILLKDTEVTLPNIEITMLLNTDSETIDMANAVGQTVVPNADNDSVVVRNADNETVIVRNSDNETVIVRNSDNETSVVPNEHENLLPSEASNAKPMIFHRPQRDFCSIKSFDRSIPESDIIHAMFDRFLRRLFCCHSDNMSND